MENQLTQALMTTFINYFGDAIPIIIAGITAACILAAAPEIMIPAYQKIFNWFHNPEQGQKDKTLVVTREGKTYHLPMIMQERLKQQGYIVYSPYDNLDTHDDQYLYMYANENDQMQVKAPSGELMSYDDLETFRNEQLVHQHDAFDEEPETKGFSYEDLEEDYRERHQSQPTRSYSHNMYDYDDTERKGH